VIPHDTQKAVTKAYSNGFFRQRLRGEDKWKGLFTGEWKPPSVAVTGAEFYFQSRIPGSTVVDDFEGAMPAWDSSTINGMVSHDTLVGDPGEGRLVDHPGAAGLDPQSPHDTQGMRLHWDSAGDRLSWEIPGGLDVSGRTVLSLRVTQVEGGDNAANQPQDMRVALKDNLGNERAIRASAFGAIPFPDQRSNAALRKSALSTIRIPLASYRIVCAGQVQVDLTNVVEMALIFTPQPTGEIEVDEIEFTD
jgi:hypothetical protein